MLTRKVVLQISCPAKHTRRQSIPRARHEPDLSVQLAFFVQLLGSAQQEGGDFLITRFCRSMGQRYAMLKFLSIQNSHK